MRFTAMMAGAVVVLAACGGAKTDAGANPDSTGGNMAATAPATTGGTTHVVNMVMEGTAYKFVPADLIIKQGDQVVFKGISGAAHNVAFWKDSIPPGAEAFLAKDLTEGTQPLATKMVVDGDSAIVSFVGAPVGKYGMYCVPHLAMGMTGSITVTP